MATWTVTQVANGLLQQVGIEADRVSVDGGWVILHNGGMVNGSEIDPDDIIALFPDAGVVSVVREEDEDGVA